MSSDQSDEKTTNEHRPIDCVLSSVQFLSRLPIPSSLANHDKPDFENGSWSFPLAGIVISLPALAIMMVSYVLGLPAEIIAALTIATQALVTGALHEDGLADIADGFGGGSTRERKLEIMKDSNVGAFGAVALVISFFMRFALLSSLLDISFAVALAGFLTAQIVSRAVQVWFWQSLPAAREDGLSSAFGTPSKQPARTAVLIGGLSLLLPLISGISPFSLALSIALIILLLVGFRKLCFDQIGGQSGDAIGAIQVLAEIAFLIGLLTFTA
ncbi:MAG: adenosylcobinamide-GDP ribazoletransferase [Hyphomicrobiales bacterium]